MPLRTIIILLFIMILAGLGYAAKERLARPSSLAQEGGIRSPKYVELGPLNVLVVQQDANSNSKRVLLCKEECSPAVPPGNVLSDTYTDGSYWYYYASAGSDHETGEHIGLYRMPIAGGNPESIIVQTPLVKPRDIVISPSGKKLIYFLDNIQEPSKHLTELWEYDTGSKAVSVLTERIYIPDMMSRVKWNRAGDVVWFVANSGFEKDPKIELITVATDPTSTAAKFQELNWQELRDIADHGIMDINSSASSLVYAETISPTSDRLVVVRGSEKQGAAVAGKVVFVQWLNSGDLLYGLQSSTGFSFWRLTGATAKEITKQTGVLRSARSDSHGNYVAIAADTTAGRTQLFTLDVASGLLKSQASVPSFGQQIHVVQVNSLPTSASPIVAGVSTSFPDDEIVPVIEKNIAAITGEKTARATRLLFTDKPNIVYVEFKNSSNAQGRVLIAIHNVINADWQVLARYKEGGSQWQKTEGAAVQDPLPTRIYEWEEALKKWILKSGRKPN